MAQVTQAFSVDEYIELQRTVGERRAFQDIQTITVGGAIGIIH